MTDPQPPIFHRCCGPTNGIFHIGVTHQVTPAQKFSVFCRENSGIRPKAGPSPRQSHGSSSRRQTFNLGPLNVAWESQGLHNAPGYRVVAGHSANEKNAKIALPAKTSTLEPSFGLSRKPK
jgi:hypothetical protein